MITLQAYTHNFISVEKSTDEQLDFIDGIEDVYTNHARHFVNWMREEKYPFTLAAVKMYCIELNQSGACSAATKRVRRAAVIKRIRQVMQNADLDTKVKLDRALNDLDRDGATKAPKLNTAEIDSDKVLSAEQWDILLSKSRGDRQRAFLEFLYHTGCRVSEMCGIRLTDIEIAETKVIIRVLGKGNKERKIRLPYAIYDRIRDTFRGELYLFETGGGKRYNRSYVSNQVKKLGQHALHKNISAHTLRHTFATRMIHKTGKIKAVSKYLGHASISTTLGMYLHETLEDSELFGD